MSKRSISIKKKILYPVLLGLVTLSSTAMATIEPRLYNGTTKHYRKGKEHNSPVLGAAALEIGLAENIRFFGPFTPAYKEDGNRDYAGDTSDNPFWQMVKIFFPSTGGGFTSQANFETNFGNNVDKVQTIVPLLSFVNDLREGKYVNVEALKEELFLTLKQRPPYDSRKEQADLEKVKNEVQDIQATTKADFIKALRGLGIDPNLKKEMIGYATNKYKPKDKPNDLDAGRLEELKGLLIGLADQSINTAIQKKQRQEDERFKKRFFQETLTPLIESIQNAVKSEKDSIFPAYTTEQLIESFFSHKFNTRENIDNLIEATPDDIVDPEVPFVSEPAIAEEILEHDVLDMDDLLALSALGMDTAPVPYQLGLKPITNGEKVWFYNRGTDQFNKDYAFSDCVDEMPRHMANMLLYNRKRHTFDVTPLLDQQKKFAEGSPQFKRLQNAIEFFTKYQSPMMSNNGATDTRSWWNRVIAALNFDGIGPKVDYVKRDNELDTGHINMLRMFQNLFSLDLDPFPVLEVVNEADPEKEKEVLLQIQQKLGLEVAPFPALKVQEEATPEQEQEAQAKLAKDILNWKTKARENIQKKFKEDRINWILSSFRTVFSFMNPDFVYDFKSENLRGALARDDVMGSITVLVKKSEKSTTPLYSFKMYQDDGHSEIKDIAYTQNQAALEIGTKPAAIEPLTAEESLWLLFPQVAKTKVTEILYQMMPRLLADNDLKINFISLLKTMDWQSTPHLATQEIAGFLSNILPTLGWDDPDTLRRITSSIRDVILDKDENLNETLPQEVREAFFKKTQSLDFQGVIKPNLAKVVSYFENNLLKTQDLKIKFMESLSGIDWKEISEENTSKMTGLLSNILPTLSWDDPNTLHRITSSIRYVILDKGENLNETVPQEVREVFFQKTQDLNLQGDIKPNLAKVLACFEKDMLKTQDLKIKFMESLNGIDWKEISEENTLKMTGLLSKVLDSLSLDTQDLKIKFIGSLSGLDWKEISEENTSKMTGLLSKVLDSLSLDTQDLKIKFIGSLSGLDWKEISEENTSKMIGLLSNVLDTLRWDNYDTLRRITSSIRAVFLDKTGKLNETVPPEIQEAIFSKTQELEFIESMKPNFMQLLLEFKNDVLLTQNSKISFLQGLKGLDWKEISEENTSKMTGLLSKVLDTLFWDTSPYQLQQITSSILTVFLDETGKLKETVPPEIREVFLQKTQSLEFVGSMKPNFALVLAHFQNDVLKTQDSKINFLQGLKDLDWKEVSSDSTSKITGVLSKVIDTFSGDSSHTLRWFTSAIRSIILDKDKNLNEAVPQEVREAIFSKTQSLEFEGAGYRGALKPNVMKILFKFKNDVLKTQNSKMSLLEVLSSLDWEKMSSEDISRIERLLSTALDTFSWDERATLQQVTNSIVGVFLDKDGRFKYVPQIIQDALFDKTETLIFEKEITDSFVKLLPRFKNEVLRLSDQKAHFLKSLSRIEWKEVSEEGVQELEGLLVKALEPQGPLAAKVSEVKKSHIPMNLAKSPPSGLDAQNTVSIVNIFLDKDGKLKDVPQVIQDAFFDKTQTLSFEKVIPDSFVKVLPRFKNEVLRLSDQKANFLESLSRIDWKGVSEENVQELAGLLTKVLSPHISSPGSASVPIPRMPPKRVVSIRNASPQRNTTAIVNVFLDKDGRFKYVPEKIQEAFFTRTQSLTFKEAIKPNFARVLPYFQKDMLTTPDLKIKFVDSLRDMAWKEVSEGDILGIAEMLSKVLDAFPWENPTALTSSIVNVLLDKTGALNALLPREIQETFFNKTRSLGFSGAIPSDFFLGLSKILPRFVQAKDTLTQLTISGGERKIEEFPESLGSLTSLALSKVKVGTAALAKLPSLNNLSFEDVTLNRLVIDPAHSNLKITTKALSVGEIQGLENLEVFQKETLSSKDPFFNEIRGLETLKFTNPNHKIETVAFEGNTRYPSMLSRINPSRIERLDHLPNLRVLDLSGSQAASIEGFESLAQLKKVKLAGSSFGQHRFSEKHHTLEELYIDDFSLQEIPGLEHLTQLKKLEITGASLGTLKFFPSNALLEEVVVEGAEIGEIQGIEHLTQLRSMTFTYGPGTYASVIDSLTFSESNAKLKELNIINSYVNSIQGLGHLKNLRSLYLPDSTLKTLNFEGELPNLRVISVQGNQYIEEINGLDKLPKLEHLDLSSTPSLRALKGLDTLPRLDSLLASGTLKLTSVKFGSVNKRLKDIDLSKSGVTSVEGVEELPDLKTLNLAGSEHLSSPIHFSEKNAKVESVDLSETGVKNLSGLENLTVAKTLDLRGLNLESLELSPNLKDTQISLYGASVGILTGLEIYIKPKEWVENQNELQLNILNNMKHIGKIVFTYPDPNLISFDVNGGDVNRGDAYRSLLSIASIEGLENFKNLTRFMSRNVAHPSLNFNQEFENLSYIYIDGQLDALTGLEHLPALKQLTIPSKGPQKLTLPEDVELTQLWGYSWREGETRTEIIRVNRPAARATHEEND